MTTKVKEENKVAKEKKEDKFNPSDYSCEIILEKTTFEKASDRSFPTDAFLVYYSLDGKDLLDVTRSAKMVSVFDMYYDRYGKDCVKKIEFGFGTVNPGQWGYKPPERKRKRKGKHE